MTDRPAPVVGVADVGAGDEPFGSYASVATAGKGLLAAELSQRLSSLGAAVMRVTPSGGDHWGRWFAAAMRDALAPDARVDAIGYASAGSLALLDDADLDDLLSAVEGEVVANNRFSADAFVAAGDVAEILRLLEALPADNGVVRHLADGGFVSRDLRARPWSRFDADTPLDLAMVRLAARLPGTRQLDQRVTAFLEMATLPGGSGLEVPHLAAVGDVIRDRGAELLVAGRVPALVLGYLETETACRIRAVVEERGMRSVPGQPPRSLLADWSRRTSAAELIDELASLADAVVLDTRVVMAGLAGSSAAATWPDAEERYASDFLDASRVSTPWLRELTQAAAAAPVPIILGGHTLVSDGLQIIVRSAWLGH